MSTYRELVYIILDQIRATSDDSLYNDAHISYLIDKYRSMLLKQKYSDIYHSSEHTRLTAESHDSAAFLLFFRVVMNNTEGLRPFH